MSLAGFALRNKAIVSTGVTILLLWGAVSYMTMPRREYTVPLCGMPSTLSTTNGTVGDDAQVRHVHATDSSAAFRAPRISCLARHAVYPRDRHSQWCAVTRHD